MVDTLNTFEMLVTTRGLAALLGWMCAFALLAGAYLGYSKPKLSTLLVVVLLLGALCMFESYAHHAAGFIIQSPDEEAASTLLTYLILVLFICSLSIGFLIVFKLAQTGDKVRKDLVALFESLYEGDDYVTFSSLVEPSTARSQSNKS